jgi:hypothetical protein
MMGSGSGIPACPVEATHALFVHPAIVRANGRGDLPENLEWREGLHVANGFA